MVKVIELDMSGPRVQAVLRRMNRDIEKMRRKNLRAQAKSRALVLSMFRGAP